MTASSFISIPARQAQHDLAGGRQRQPAAILAQQHLPGLRLEFAQLQAERRLRSAQALGRRGKAAEVVPGHEGAQDVEIQGLVHSVFQKYIIRIIKFS